MRAKKKSDENFPPLSSDDQRPSAFGVTATPLQYQEDEGDDCDGQKNEKGRMEEGGEREGEKIKNHFQKKVSIINCETLAVIKFKKPAHTTLRSALCSTTADRSSI